MDKDSITLFPRYNPSGASSRYRIYQYLPFWKLFKGEIKIKPFFNKTSNHRELGFPLLFLFFRRIWNLLKLNYGSKIIIEKELFPFFFDFIFLLKIFKIKYVIDFDDAIFHNYDLSRNFIIRKLLKNKIPELICGAEAVITGSPYLTNYALQYNKNVFEIPTSIVFENYKRRLIVKDKNKFIIGWIGSKSTSNHLLLIKDAIIEFSNKNECEFHLIGFDRNLYDFENEKIKVIDWESQNEVENICQFDVGIMPLSNSPFENGKCGFKLVQYMACGIPTISTPLDANLKINRNNKNLFANTCFEWIDCFNMVLLNQNFYKEIGKKNKEIVRKYYSVESNSKIYDEIFTKFFFNN